MEVRKKNYDDPYFGEDGCCIVSVGDELDGLVDDVITASGSITIGGQTFKSPGVSGGDLYKIASQRLRAKYPWLHGKIGIKHFKSAGDTYRCMIQFQSKSLKKLYVFLKCLDARFNVDDWDGFGDCEECTIWIGHSLTEDHYIHKGEKSKMLKGRAADQLQRGLEYTETLLDVASKGGPVAAIVGAAALPLWITGEQIVKRQKYYKYWVRIFPSCCADLFSKHGLAAVSKTEGLVLTTDIAELLSVVYERGDLPALTITGSAFK